MKQIEIEQEAKSNEESQGETKMQKRRTKLIALLVLCSVLAWLPANAQTAWAAARMPGLDASITKNNVMKLLNQYDRDGAYIMKKQLAQGDNILQWFSGGRIIGGIDTAVHEETHSYQTTYATWRKKGRTQEPLYAFFVGNKKTIKVPYTKVFRTKKMAKTIPKNLRTFRYDTYVGKPEANQSSNMDGAYGLLDEFMAYRTGMNTILSLYPYCEQQNADWGAWEAFINDCENDKLAYAEFKYYILHYLWYAKKKEPKVYKGIVQNKRFCKAYRQIERRYARQIKAYGAYLKKMERFFTERDVEIKITDKKIEVTDAYGYSGWTGRETADYNKLQKELKKSRYQKIHKKLVKNQ